MTFVPPTHRQIASTADIGHNTQLTAESLVVSDRAVIGDNVAIDAKEVRIGEGSTVEAGVRFRGDRLILEAGAVLRTGVHIEAALFNLGYKSVIEEGCRLSAIRSLAKVVDIGDFTSIGYDSKFLVPALHIGDYCSLFNHLLVNGYATCRIGHNCYVGQHTVLNASDELTIGNNVRLALNCYIWTHIESGELLEGCRLYGRKPVTIEDDVWLTGCNISISPGVTLAQGSIILHGSVVSKSTQSRHCYSGVPAHDVTEKIRPYSDVTLDQKFKLMKHFLEEFLQEHQDLESSIWLCDTFPEEIPCERPFLIIAAHGTPRDYGDGVSSFSIETKQYTKRRTAIEEAFIRFHVGCKARFVPLSLPGPFR